MRRFWKYFFIALLGQIVGITLLIFLIESTSSEILWKLFLAVYFWPSVLLLKLFGGVGETDITLSGFVLILFYSLVLAGLWILKSRLGSHTQG
jgi:hypothetical protein